MQLVRLFMNWMQPWTPIVKGEVCRDWQDKIAELAGIFRETLNTIGEQKESLGEWLEPTLAFIQYKRELLTLKALKT